MTDVRGGQAPDAVRLVAEPGSSAHRRAVRRRRVLYGLTTAVLIAVVGLAVLDGLHVTRIFGASTAHATADGGGYHLDVRYAAVSRPGLATPLQIVVERPGGFDAPVTIAVTGSYFEAFDENGLDPDPSKATTAEDLLVWEFEPPPWGERLIVSFDGRIEPSRQSGASASVAVVEDGEPVVDVDVRTRVMP